MSLDHKREFLTASAYQARFLYTDPSSVLRSALQEFYDLDAWCEYWKRKRSAYKKEFFPNVAAGTGHGGNEIILSTDGFNLQARGQGGGISRTFNIPYHPFSPMAMSNGTIFQPPPVHHHHYNISNVHNGDKIGTKNVTTEGSGSMAVLKKLDNIEGGISDLKLTSSDILATAKKASLPSGEQFKAGDKNTTQDFEYSTPAPRHLRFETLPSQSLASCASSQPQNL
jgi:hypothetical protein